MRINWGTGLVIGMALFISFIMFFIITMSTDKKYSYDLVAEDYYKKELQLQEDIDAATNEAELKTPVIGTKTKAGYVLQFPETFNPKNITGKVFLYRPSGKQLDFDIPIELSTSNLLIPDNRLLDGRWNITVNWEYEGKKYHFQKAIIY
ncbi:FixH family protein [Leeuwenhoekiella marinoflava]|uniref:Nitrogen fixation protein FixH n=2 Tax=Leeuwenhoekiella marinoflava TaxID=988 RepID=A0A4Q0PN72_9FLAO|nr:FixH family protein [Leeuwenhoekiella marinoflava]RXG31937.1 nitrogen fixation protein FixH [Leeuwenhoekiella marinoflava]SHE92259.1 Nitrogen fixation protein FixH [Leeuwenhoekiella marinoflava DSM 3653]